MFPWMRSQKKADKSAMEGTIDDLSIDAAASIPLLVQGLEGGTRQLTVPATASVDELRGLILGDEAGAAEGYKLALGDTELESGLKLANTQVIPTYTHATSLLQVIGNSRLEPQRTAEALDSVCGIVRSLSNGVTDVNALCSAASRSLDEALAASPPPVAAPPEPLEFEYGGSINEVFPESGTRDDSAATTSVWGETPSPATLVRRLSKTMPSLFVPEVSETFVRDSMRDLGASGLDFTPPLPLDDDDLMNEVLTGEQPHITDIRRIRRGERRDSKTGVLPDIATQSAAAAASGFGSRKAVMAKGGDSTWMDDVTTTWVSGLVHESKTLDKTATGKELRKKLDEMAQEERSDSNDSGRGVMEIDSAGETEKNRVVSPSSSSSTGGRKATKIAPSPVVTGLSGVASGLQRGGLAVVAQAMPALRHMPIKRGRKEKYPDMSPEARRQMRKEQKRRSARESRIRKKTMEEGYQQKLKTLISENGTLKHQVTDLTHKLQVLQGLLTVTVRPIRDSLPRPPAQTMGNGAASSLSAMRAAADAAADNCLREKGSLANGPAMPQQQTANCSFPMRQM